MAKVMVGMTMSLDGFVQDQNGSVGRLYPDLADLRTSELLQDAMKATGAVAMGRQTYDMAQGDFTGYEYQVPIFVLTHEAPKTVAKGENDKLKFSFVTDGIESVIQKAKAAAGSKDVTVVGGANFVQELLKAGLVDQLEVGIIPVFFGSGLRFFENLADEQVKLEKVKVIETGARTDLIFRVVK
ncbi:MAG: dihydrofolate reductase family protein [Chloroflexota bacterium]